MLTDDKVRGGSGRAGHDDHNRRDGRHVGIWLLVLVGIFLSLLVMLGKSHAPGTSAESHQPESIGQGHEEESFSVNKPIGSMELPGTIGQPQHFLSGHGNTPVPPDPADVLPPAPPSQASAPPPAGH